MGVNSESGLTVQTESGEVSGCPCRERMNVGCVRRYTLSILQRFFSRSVMRQKLCQHKYLLEYSIYIAIRKTNLFSAHFCSHILESRLVTVYTMFFRSFIQYLRADSMTLNSNRSPHPSNHYSITIIILPTHLTPYNLCHLTVSFHNLRINKCTW